MIRTASGRSGRASPVVMGTAAVCAWLAIGAAAHGILADHLQGTEPSIARAADPKDDAASRSAFLAAYKVLMSPRCMNCHPSGDAPLQGDDSHTHTQNVKRGPDGKGKYALKCANCHQEANLPGENMPPGNPNWRLPAPETPLVFQGKTPAELAQAAQGPQAERRQDAGAAAEARLGGQIGDRRMGSRRRPHEAAADARRVRAKDAGVDRKRGRHSRVSRWDLPSV